MLTTRGRVWLTWCWSAFGCDVKDWPPGPLGHSWPLVEICERVAALRTCRRGCPGVHLQERAADSANQRGWVVLLARYQRLKAIRRAGTDRLAGVIVSMPGFGYPAWS